MVLVLLVAAAISAFVVPLPYYVDSAGTVRATQPLVTVEGHRSYTSKGKVFFLTVSEKRATAALLVQAWLDDTIDVLPSEVVNPTGDREKETRIEQQAMDESKLTALTVAFDRLRLPVTVTGTGARVIQVTEGFDVADFLRPGDVIVALDGRPITVKDDVRPLLSSTRPGDRVEVTAERRTPGEEVRRRSRTIELGTFDDQPDRGFLGVVIETADEQVDLPFDVELDSGAVIGPSAGLAWTLGVIDRLTPGDLTGGRRVAVTGTIGPDGSVGPIGGIAQKAAGALEEHATLFLYPADTDKKEVRRVRRIVGDRMRLRPVASIDDALRALGAPELATTPS